MVFCSLSFLYLFFPLCALAYYAGKNRVWRNSVLLAFSLVFYAWGEPKNIALLLLASFAAYAGGLWMERLKERGRSRGRRAVFWATVVLLAGNLFVFKYLNFFCDNLGGLLGQALPVPRIALPIGVSFYTFQILSYTVDVYYGRVAAEHNFIRFGTFVTLFPQLIAGPIVKYTDINEELHARTVTPEMLGDGVRLFIMGLGS